jgi:threonine dehydrogenase-like Zn-dependent dehydrogenase
MRGVVMYSAGDVRVEEREDPRIIEPTDAIVRLTATCICGSDLWPYRGVEPADHQVMGHEYVGVVEEIGADVKDVKVGDFVVGSFVISDNTCEVCQSGFQSQCVHAEFVASSDAHSSHSISRPTSRTSPDSSSWTPEHETSTTTGPSRAASPPRCFATKPAVTRSTAS